MQQRIFLRPTGSWRRRVVLQMVGIVSRIFAKTYTRLEVFNTGTLERLLDVVPRQRGLLTVSNHMSVLDDPFVWGALLPLSFHTMRALDLRWTLGADDVVFRYSWIGKFFRLGQVIPVARGRGLWQAGLDESADLLRKKEWVHIFPEAYVNQSGLLRPLRWGAARLIMEGNCPIVLPIWHIGMERLLPEGSIYLPRPFCRIRVVVGDPIDFTNLLEHHRIAGHSDETTRAHIMDVLTAVLLNLRRTALSIGGEWDGDDSSQDSEHKRKHRIEHGITSTV